MLPKTRSGKIMRRVLKAVILDRDPGDITTIEDEGSVDEARQAWQQMKGAISQTYEADFEHSGCSKRAENSAAAGRGVARRVEPGEVVIKAAYSSVNYKDALAATGAGKIMRPLSADRRHRRRRDRRVERPTPRFKPGDPVLVTGYDLGVAHDGGYCRVRAGAGGLGGAHAARATLVRRDGDWHGGVYRGAVDRRDGTQRPRSRRTVR